MSEILSIGLGILIIPILLTVISPLIDNIFTEDVIDLLNVIIWYIDNFIWSKYTNILFIMISLAMFIKIIKRILKIIKWE